MSDPTYQSQTL